MVRKLRTSRTFRRDATTCMSRHPGARPCRPPYLAGHLMMVRTHLVDLNVISIQVRRQTPRLKLLGSFVEFRDAALELHAHPKILILVEAQSQNPCRHFGFQRWDRVFGCLSGLGVELSQNLLAEAGIPG